MNRGTIGIKFFCGTVLFFLTVELLFIVNNSLAKQEIQSAIYTVYSMADLEKYVTEPGTLVLFDLQDTLIRSEYLHAAPEKKEVIKEVLLPYVPYERHLKWLLSKQIEKESTDIIHMLKKRGMIVGILTKNSHLDCAHTWYQLAYMNIDLSDELRKFPKTFCDGSQSKVIIDNGVISAGLNGKGEALALFLDALQYTPKNLVFIDDKLKFIQDVKKTAEARGINFIGLQYIH